LCLAGVIDRWYRSNAQDAEGIGAVVLFGYVNDDGSIDDGTEWNGAYVEPREAEETTSDYFCCNEVDATYNCLH